MDRPVKSWVEVFLFSIWDMMTQYTGHSREYMQVEC